MVSENVLNACGYVLQKKKKKQQKKIVNKQGVCISVIQQIIP